VMQASEGIEPRLVGAQPTKQPFEDRTLRW
jgi:hypothetical protein